MNALFFLALLLFAPQDRAGQAFRLDPGEYRWLPFTVKQTPAELECKYEVLQGGPTVHAELLPMSEFRLLNRGKTHQTIAATSKARTAGFQRLIQVGGQYAVVIVNEKNAAPATVSLEVHLNANPRGGAVAQTLPPGRRLAVIFVSFAFFFVTVTWSAHKLLRTMRQS